MKSLRLTVWVVIFCCVGWTNALAQATPTDVHNRLLEFAAEVDLIRLEMGIEASARPDLAVSGAQPREVYFQALTLFEKSNRLLFEQLRERADRTDSPPVADVDPDDVLVLVNSSLDLVLRVKQSLGIAETAAVDPPSGNRTPTDVYKQIVRINRTLNTLLKRQFAPADVYQQLTHGVGLAASVLATVSSSNRLGTAPEYVRRKTPVDVYRELVRIYGIVRDIMELSGESCLEIDASELDRPWVSPSDVYDMASLVISELSYLHSISPGTAEPRESYFPGDKLPSDVYQRAGRLENQLQMLRRHMSTRPKRSKAM